MRLRGAALRRYGALLACVAVLIVTACGSESGAPKVPTIDPGQAAQAPVPTAAPAGEVSAVPGAVVDLVATADGVAALVGDTVIIGARRIPLGSPATSLVAGAAGELLAVSGTDVLRVALDSGTVTKVEGGGPVHAVTMLADGRLAVGLGTGTLRLIDLKSNDVQTISGLVSIDGLAAAGGELLALDARQTLVSEMNTATRSPGLALRAGAGAAKITADRHRRILVTDPRGGELLVFGTDPLVLRQRFPVSSAPYAVAYDGIADIAWVTLTGTNELVGFDLSRGIPREVARYHTVRQPNAIAVDPAGRVVYVGSGSGAGLQRIATGAQR